jgi:hypothetical protein
MSVSMSVSVSVRVSVSVSVSGCWIVGMTECGESKRKASQYSGMLKQTT